MAGYYDRLEAELERATARGAAGGRVPWGVRLPRIRMDVVAVALGVAAVVAVAAVFVGLGRSHRLARQVARPPMPSNVRHAPSTARVIRNYAPGRAPALGGERMSSTALRPPGARGSRSGVVTVNYTPPNRFAFSISAFGLPPKARGARDYAVWIVPAVRTSSGAIQVQGGAASGPGLSPYAERVGVIKPGPANGRISAQGVLPSDVGGAVLLILTPSGPAPTRIILEAYVEF
jgi:hypothetical protein